MQGEPVAFIVYFSNVPLHDQVDNIMIAGSEWMNAAWHVLTLHNGLYNMIHLIPSRNMDYGHHRQYRRADYARFGGGKSGGGGKSVSGHMLVSVLSTKLELLSGQPGMPACTGSRPWLHSEWPIVSGLRTKSGCELVVDSRSGSSSW